MKQGAKKLFTLIVCTSILMSCSNKRLEGQSRSDTTIIARYNEDDYHVVFIDKDKSSFYETILNGAKVDPHYYNNALQEIKDSANVSIKRFSLSIRKEWVSLNIYKNKFYVYSPSEPYVNLHFDFNDSTVIMNFFADGFLPSIIETINYRKDGSIEIKTKGLYKEYAQLLIHFLSKQKDVAIIEFPLKNKENRYHLVCAKDSIKRYPIIVNYCPGRRCDEWQFDKPDFALLLKKGR